MRYVEILVEIKRQGADAARDAELKAAAERLNPDNWQTEVQVQVALEDYESVFQSVREVVGRGRRRPREGGHGRAPSPDTSATAPEQRAVGAAAAIESAALERSPRSELPSNTDVDGDPPASG